MLASLLLLGGCTSSSIKNSLQDAQRIAGEPAEWIVSDAQRNAARAQADALLLQPLGIDDAVRLTLVNSRALQVLLSEHAATVAQLDAEGRAPNPGFVFERMLRGEATELTRTLSIGLAELITWPQRRRLAKAQTQAQVLRTASQITQQVGQTRQLWVMAVAAQQAQRYYEDVLEVAQTGDALAERMAAAGNFSALQRAHEAQFLSDALMQRSRAVVQARVLRERLIRQLGLDRDQAQRLQLPEHLPSIPEAPRDAQQTATRAFDERLDVRLAKTQLLASARAQGITRVSSWIDGMHLAGIRKSETGEAKWKGFELELPLPLFDWGDAHRAGAQARFMVQLNRTAQVAVDAQSQVAQAHAAYESAFEVAHHYQTKVVPLQQQISEENVYRYNGMLIGVFELLADARAQAASVIGAISAQRDFWLADVALEGALLGLPSNVDGVEPVATAGGAKAGH